MAGILTRPIRRCVLSNKNYGVLSQLVAKNLNTQTYYGSGYSGNEHSSKFRYGRAVLAGVLGYVLYKKFEFPVVEAALPFTGGGDNSSLKGRRDKFNFIADVVRVCAPSVVYIEIKDTRRVDYFTGQPTTISNGSGFIVQEDGLILTNAHVVVSKSQSMVLVRLQDGTTYNGTVEDVDMKSDLATVRIPVKGLPVMKLGLSSDILPGEWVIALGSPLALSNTVTAGVVSSTQRGSDELGLSGKDMSYIQTDAAITFGNSGGPLINLDGEAIGINSMKVTSGISFAIPIDYAKQFLSRRKENSATPVSKRYLGITMLSLTPHILRELRQRNPEMGQDITHGVLVWKVILGSPAYAGGLRPGDIVTHINGKKMHSANDVYQVLEQNTPVLSVKVSRSNTFVELTIKPEDPSS